MKNELSILTFLSVQSIRTRYRAVSTAFSRWANLMSCLLRRQTLLVVALCVCSSVSYAQLSGTDSVGSGCRYAAFTDAVSALTSLGVSGPVALIVISGSYNEQIQIGRIAGASAVNTITFKAQSGSAADVTLSFTPTSSNTYVVQLNRATYIRFQCMTF